VHESSSRPVAALILGVCVAIGLTLAGFFVARAVESAKRFDRFVTVKGLSEREVSADLAIWPIRFNVAANDLKTLQDQIAAGRNTVRQFLIASHFKDDEISTPPPQITDAQTSPRGEYDERKPPTLRYSANVTLLLRSTRIEDVRKTMEASDQLVQSGVALSGGDYAGRAEFLFTGINDIKPGMIEEATVNARKAAEKFAKDSNSLVGTIRRATQAPIEVNDRDSSSPHRKIVRIVTTVDYFLE
jgi:uncharacterized protein